MKISKTNATALIIDLQEKIIPAMSNPVELIEKSKLLLSGLSIHSIPLVLTRQYPKGLGDTIPEIKKVTQFAKTFDKTSFSCLDVDDIRNYFNGDSRPNVIIVGIETHICVLQTALDLMMLGKNVYLVADCVASRNPFDQKMAFARMFNSGVIPATVESLLFELTKRAGSDEFKKISKLVTGRE